MARNVALSNDAYRTLESLKRSGESFSDVVNRLAGGEKRPNWRESVGVFKGDKEILNIYGKILKERHITKKGAC